ncbi:metallophosphoesterase [bacterium]|nr:metallophosphoesterase [bacterium]
MTRIGVISDTHLLASNPKFEALMEKHLRSVDMVVHAGDMVTLDVLEVFLQMDREVTGVCGNMDHPDVRAAYPNARIITVEDLRIGIIHGWGSPDGIRKRIRGSFEEVDAIIYGHTHQAHAALEAGIFYFNPGSVTDSRFTSRCSLGIITVDKGTIRGEIIPV